MGQRIILSEEEKRNIQEMYGLINEIEENIVDKVKDKVQNRQPKITALELVTKYKDVMMNLFKTLNGLADSDSLCDNVEGAVAQCVFAIKNVIKKVQVGEKVNTPDEAIGLLLDKLDSKLMNLVDDIIRKVNQGRSFEMSKELKDGILEELRITYDRGDELAKAIDDFISRSNVPVRGFCK